MFCKKILLEPITPWPDQRAKK